MVETGFKNTLSESEMDELYRAVTVLHRWSKIKKDEYVEKSLYLRKLIFIWSSICVFCLNLVVLIES